MFTTSHKIRWRAIPDKNIPSHSLDKSYQGEQPDSSKTLI